MYLETHINNSFNEIMIRILAVIKGYLEQDTLVKSKSLSIRSKPTLKLSTTSFILWM